MEKEELKKWLKIGSEISINNNEFYLCPVNEDHLLSYEVIPFKEYNKMEIKLKCLECDISYTLTKDIVESK